MHLSRTLRPDEFNGRLYRRKGQVRLPRIVRGAVTRQVKGQYREAAFGEPRRQLAPTIEVASLIVDQHSPAVCLTCALAAQNDAPGTGELD